MDFKTIFDGWGTELIGLLVSICFAGGVVWCYKKGKVTQKQKAENNAKQYQEITTPDEKHVKQEQEAGDNSEQTQIG